MGADGRLLNPDLHPVVNVTCARCSLVVSTMPRVGHADCLDSDGGLPVQLEVAVPYEER